MEVITLKFLEPGHRNFSDSTSKLHVQTNSERRHSMSADAAHHLVQKKLSKAKDVCDFRDFTDLVEASGMQMELLNHTDFLLFEDGMSKTKPALGREGLRSYLSTVRAIKVKHGSQKIFLKMAHSDSQWRAFDLLKPSYDLSAAPDHRTEARGMNKGKIDRICQALASLMSDGAAQAPILAPSSGRTGWKVHPRTDRLGVTEPTRDAASSVNRHALMAKTDVGFVRCLTHGVVN